MTIAVRRALAFACLLLVGAAEPPRRCMPRRCGWQLEIVRNTLAYTGSKLCAVNLRELRNLAKEYESAKRGGDDGAMLCGRELAALLRDLGLLWGSECSCSCDPELVISVLRMHATLFPDDDADGVIAYALATQIAISKLWGDRRHWQADWKEAASWFRRARSATTPRIVTWDAEKMPLSIAATIGEAVALLYAELPDAQRDDLYGWSGHMPRLPPPE
jgi:hypothetical protein